MLYFSLKKCAWLALKMALSQKTCRAMRKQLSILTFTKNEESHITKLPI